jgi:uncharacterized protein
VPQLRATDRAEDLYSVNPVAAMGRVKRPLLVVVGLKDTVVTPQPTLGRLVPVDGDHIFDVMTDQGPAVLDNVIAWSLAWLQQTL